MKIDVKHIAKLANLTLTDEEIKKFENQLSETIEYVEQLKEVDTTDVPSANQVTGLENIFSNDEAQISLSQEEALSNAKSTHNGMFKVNAILEDSD